MHFDNRILSFDRRKNEDLMNQIVVGTNGSYEVIKSVAKSGGYNVHLCVPIGSKYECLLQIASSAEHNGDLERVAFILKELENRAIELENEYQEKKKDPNILLNYGLGFPELLDSFVFEKQGGRSINILAFRNVDKVNRMVPLINITSIDRQRIDPRTSAWIMGKLLKMLAFAHSMGISIGLTTGNNILIEPKEHYVVIFDWFFARINPEAVPRADRIKEISEAAKAVIISLGGNPETGLLINDEDRSLAPYADYLLWLAQGKEADAKEAHDKFYELVDALWKREYYPFTTEPLIELEE